MEHMNIKQTVRNGLIRGVGYTGLVSLYRRVTHRKGSLVRVLCFHDVPDAAWFDTVVGFLAEQYTLITPTQFHERAFDAKQLNLLLTFDDGYQSWVDVAAPVLERYGTKGLFFTCSGLLDAADMGEEAVGRFTRERLQLQRRRQVLTWEGARQLIARGHTIGGHTISHSRLSTLTNDDLVREVREDKERLEEMLTVQLQDFAYPFGRATDFTNETIKVVAATGYSHQYDASSGFARVDDLGSVRTIPRTLLDEELVSVGIKHLAEGGYDIVQSIKIWS